MTQNVTLTYLFDPLCGWCYGASAGIAELARDPSIDVHPIPTGLFAGADRRPLKSFAAQAWAMDQRIAALSGQRFSEDYRRDVLGDDTAFLDSTVATRAIVAVSEIAPDRVIEALRVIQTARYVGGKDVTSAPVVAGLLDELGLSEAGARVMAPDEALFQAVDDRTSAARRLMSAHRLQGVPSLLADIAGVQRPLDASALYSDTTDLLTALKRA